MKMRKWSETEAAGNGGSKLPAGGYVIRITKVEDNDAQEFLTIRYDIAEGEHANHFSDDFAESHPYIHEFRRYYTDKAVPFFKAFLDAIEASNPDFSIEEWEKTQSPFDFEGKILGAVFQYTKYTNGRGEDKERSEFIAAYPAQDIRDGNFKVPEVKDQRANAKGDGYGYNPYAQNQQAGGDAYAKDESIPFL